MSGIVYGKVIQDCKTVFFVRNKTYNDKVCVVGDEQELSQELGKMINIGDEIWWQADKIYFGDSDQSIPKIDYSYAAPKLRICLQINDA